MVSSVASPASALSLLSFLIPAGGQLFHNPVSDRLAGRGGSQAARFLRDDVDTQVQNSRDFIGDFVPNFFRDFARFGVQAGAAAASNTQAEGGGTRQPIVLQLGGRTLEEVIVELDNMEQEGRIVRRRKANSIVD